MPMMPLAPKAATVFSGLPPPLAQALGTGAKLSPITWNGILALVSPAMVKSAVRTEPQT